MKHALSKQPVIGISPAVDMALKYVQSAETHYLRRTYTETISSVGGIPLIINMDMPIGAILSICDGIVISGGEDIDPAQYGEAKIPVPGAMAEPTTRINWERELMDACDGVGMPILGICYGMQLQNIHYGGSLYQNIAQQRDDSMSHQLTRHNIEFTEDFLGFSRGNVHEIESRHHQAIDRLADGFEVVAVAPDGIVEAIRKGHHFGIQWHPESDETGVHIYRAFVEYCAPGLDVSSSDT